MSCAAGAGSPAAGCCSLSGFGLHFLSLCFGGGSLRFNLVQHFGLDGFPGFGGSRRFSSGRVRYHLHAFGGLGGTAATAGTTAAAVAFDHLLTVTFRRIRGGRLTVFGVSLGLRPTSASSCIMTSAGSTGEGPWRSA